MDHKQLLRTRISIIMVRENYNFLNSPSDYQVKLNKYFQYTYSEEEIKQALIQLEEEYIFNELNEERERGIIEGEEDY